MRDNGPLHAFWKCEYGHVLDVPGKRPTKLGAMWSISPDAAKAGALSRTKALVKALRILLIQESTGAAWRWRGWMGEPEQAWPPANVARVLRDAAPDAVAIDETQGINALLDVADEFGD